MTQGLGIIQPDAEWVQSIFMQKIFRLAYTQEGSAAGATSIDF
jgi:hypothetical protein